MFFSRIRASKLIFASALVVTTSLQPVLAEEMDTVTERISYIFGYNMGQRFAQDGVEIDVDAFASAMQDAADGKQPNLSEEEMQSAMRAFQSMQEAKKAEFIKNMGEDNLKQGEAFLAENAKKEGVKVTDSGLQYKVITAGKGDSPTRDSQVSVHYRGTLLDGTEFDSSYRRGQPAEFGVTQVIPGWTEALLMMQEGDKWEVYIPANLAYGAGGAGREIGPNATLIFEIELLDVK
jgi:FKBP-type peptidyl-prolyl cis-trans isomerase